MGIRDYLPNKSDRLAIVSTSDREPFRAYWPMVITQIVGGRTWSLSFIRHTTPSPVLTEVLIAVTKETDA